MSLLKKLVASVEMIRRLDANHRVKMIVGKIQFGRVHDVEGAVGRSGTRIGDLRVGNIDAGNRGGRNGQRQPLRGGPRSARDIKHPSSFVWNARNELINELFARLALRFCPSAPVSEIAEAAVLVVAPRVPISHHTIIHSDHSLAVWHWGRSSSPSGNIAESTRGATGI